MRLSHSVQNLISLSFHEARSREHQYITPEHLLYCLLQEDTIRVAIDSLGKSPDFILGILDRHLGEFVPKKKDAEPVQSIGFEEVFQRAFIHCEGSEKSTIEMIDIFISLLEQDKCFAAEILSKVGIVKSEFIHAFPDHHDAADGDSFLDQYTFTPEPSNTGTFIRRDGLVERVLQIISRKQKNNVLLVGDPGVGKTFVLNSLGTILRGDEAPAFLGRMWVQHLNCTNLLSGQRMRGDLEERLKQVLQRLSTQGRGVLIIDDFQNLLLSGSGNALSSEVAQIFKNSLDHSDVRIIASLGFDDYKKSFDKDQALGRRFQRFDLSETSRDETFTILKSIRKEYEEHFNVSYSDKILKKIVALSSTHLSERFLPDKAIDVLDELGAYLRLNNKRQGRLRASIKHVDAVIASMAGLKVQQLSEEGETLQTLELRIKKELFGQSDAVRKIVDAVKRNRAGFGNPQKPVGSFLFVGPTGVGKTELARLLARETGVPLHRFDMSEYQEQHTVSRLIGSPPGYVGFDEGGQLTDAIRKNPHSVVLLDEIEKAHHEIYNILLQIMDYGTLTDNTGRKADFRNTILIMTSNAGAGDMDRQKIGFTDDKSNMSELKRAVEKAFTPEFRNRLDGIVLFHRLHKDAVKLIVEKELAVVKAQLAAKDIQLVYSNDIIDAICTEGYSEEFGARNIARTVDQKIRSLLIDPVLQNKIKAGNIVQLVLIDGAYSFELA